MNWKLIIILVSAFGIIKEFRPATPFLTAYLISPPKNFTNIQLYSEIYPFWTYSYLIALVPSFFLTDLLRYKPIAITEAIALCITWILLLWGKTIWQMQIMQIAFGIASACELGYESYMFLIVDKKYYKLVSSYTRAATLIGRFLAYALAQFLVSFNYGSYLLLNQISFGAVCVVIPIAIAFPPITLDVINSKAQSKQTHDKRQTSEVTSDETINVKDFNGTKSENIDKSVKSQNANYNIAAYFRFISQQFKIFKYNKNVLKWSIWWALTSCGIYQVMNYVQSLWATMQNISDNFNAITECINTFIGAAISFSMQYIRKDWTVHDELMLAITSATTAILLIIMSQSKSVIIAYILYVGVTAIYNLLMTAACATIASELDSASYGFVFGLNTFIALLIETIITFAFADKHGFALSIRNQAKSIVDSGQKCYKCEFILKNECLIRAGTRNVSALINNQNAFRANAFFFFVADKYYREIKLQFLVYGGYFGIIGLMFVIIICWKYIMRWWRDQHQNILHIDNNVSSYDNNNASFSSITI